MVEFYIRFRSGVSRFVNGLDRRCELGVILKYRV